VSLEIIKITQYHQLDTRNILTKMLHISYQIIYQQAYQFFSYLFIYIFIYLLYNPKHVSLYSKYTVLSD